ncbi:hypothetical protein Acr_05g0011360 [Actinidia rufa]|uniref:Uncharacterized protein n=1 Tax=Actinidia rufa TaxID=165716 RepID=A0A7J0EPK6_9ERIC|nr:hypothetical protein Acr_05g0011360 [Actinidia rufa]
MVLTKHASNDPRDDDPNPPEPEMIFRPQFYKSLDIKKTWLLEFKNRPVITGREFEKKFPLKYYIKMLTPMDWMEWIPTSSYGCIHQFEGTSSQGGPPAWVIDLQASLMEVKRQQAKIIQNQKQHEEYMDRLRDTYHELRQQVYRLGNFYEQGQRVDKIGNFYETMHEQHTHQLDEINAQLEGLWVHLVAPPPYALGEAPPRPSYRAPPY